MKKPPKEKPSLHGRVLPYHTPDARTRIRTEVALNTVDVGTHDIIIQRPRHPTPEEKEIWPDTEVVIDTIHIKFSRDENKLPSYTVKASVCHDQT